MERFRCWDGYFFLAGHALLAGPGCKQWEISKEKSSFLPMWEMELGVPSALIKIILNVSPWLFEIFGFTPVSGNKLSDPSWDLTWAETLKTNQTGWTFGLHGTFYILVPHLYWDSDTLIQCVNDYLVRCCSAKQFRALACHKLNPESREDLNGKEGDPDGLNAPVLPCSPALSVLPWLLTRLSIPLAQACSLVQSQIFVFWDLLQNHF